MSSEEITTDVSRIQYKQSQADGDPDSPQWNKISVPLQHEDFCSGIVMRIKFLIFDFSI